jgi:hypothetical protein
MYNLDVLKNWDLKKKNLKKIMRFQITCKGYVFKKIHDFKGQIVILKVKLRFYKMVN